ncbi:NACHT, LRR and PYD domains-containing protein 12-like [Ptychodera flava]|uniref:NACHT, LRR and PYD domains-containing protein 12-like n=1 Tax=Ptychodera flava TaxID=63121 RepID=UPI003969F615
MPASIKWLVKHLKESYWKLFDKLQPLPWNDTFFLKLSDVYTKLEVAEVGNRGEKVKRQGFSKQSEHRTVSEREIFGSSESAPTPKRIIIEGAPAVGKSTFCRKLAYDWADGNFGRYKLAFFLEVRHVQNKSIVETIFDQLLPDDSKISKEKLEEFLSANEDSILLIFDGLDEIDNTLKEDAKSVPNRIIQKKLLSNCTVVITSRPHEVDGQLIYCDSHFKINGFTAEDREKYILKYFNDNVESVEKLTKCLNDCYIFLDDDEEIILSNPLNVLYVCVFWEDHQNDECFPTKMTDLYEKILEFILTRYCTINKIDIDPENGIDLAKGKVPGEIKTAVDTLAEIAYNTMKEEL